MLVVSYGVRIVLLLVGGPSWRAGLQPRDATISAAGARHDNVQRIHKVVYN